MKKILGVDGPMLVDELGQGAHIRQIQELCFCVAGQT